MTTPMSEGTSMLDRTDREAALYRVALCAFPYYPDRAEVDPGYTVDEDIEWCLAPLGARIIVDGVGLRAAIREVITDRGADRQAFITRLRELAAG